MIGNGIETGNGIHCQRCKTRMKQTYGCHIVYEVGKGYVVLHHHLTIDLYKCGQK